MLKWDHSLSTGVVDGACLVTATPMPEAGQEKRAPPSICPPREVSPKGSQESCPTVSMGNSSPLQGWSWYQLGQCWLQRVMAVEGRGFGLGLHGGRGPGTFLGQSAGER